MTDLVRIGVARVAPGNKKTMGGVDRLGSELLGGRYRLVEQLGAGGMSVVWRGYDEVLGRRVAVKVLASRLATDPAFRHRIRVEAQAVARLCHPHITNVYDYGESIQDDVTVPYVVMELVDGESLAARLARDGTLPWADAVLACAEVASALATAHARGVVHRDVTPGNVMLTAAGVKVLDFGISALAGERDAGPDGNLLGTPAYLAPERLDDGQVSPATDVYALGLLLYRSLTGRLPWQAATTTQMLRAHRYRAPEPMPPVEGLPGEVVELCARCLAKAPAARPDSAEVARTLAAVVGVPAVIPVSPAPAGAGETGERPGSALAGTTILPSSIGTDPLPLTGAGRGTSPHRRRVEAVAVGVGLLAITGLVWGAGGDSPGDGGQAHGGSAIGMGLPDLAGCEVEYQLRKDNGRGFEADLVVTNTGAEAARDWQLAFTFPGDQTVTRARSANWEQRGQEVVVRPATGRALAAGESVSLGLSGSYRGANPLPVTFRLDGATCEVEVSADGGGAGSAAVTGQPARPPEATRAGKPDGTGEHGRSQGKGPGGPKGRD